MIATLAIKSLVLVIIFNICCHAQEEGTLRIIGGNETDEDRYSYQAIIGRIRKAKPNVWSCGGTLIAPDVILTAAHCIPEKRRELKKFGAHIGRYDISDLKEPIGKDVKEQIVRRVKIHPNYVQDVMENRTDYTFDAALMFFPNKFTRSFNDFQYVSLNRDTIVPVNGDALSVVGWGTTNEDDDGLSDIKLEAVVSYDEACTVLGDLYVPNIMLCGDGDGVTGTCRGDSGGPILVKGPNDASDVQVGITSFSVGGCAQEGSLVVYTRLSNPDLIDWINEEVCKRSTKPPSEFNCEDLCYDNVNSCENVSERNCKRRRFRKRCCASCEQFN